MRAAVIGLGFGDEGKGMVVSALATHFGVGQTGVVRYSGGHQAGHTVEFRDVKHTFANFGSGTLFGCPTYWSKHCTFEPVGFLNELSVLVEKMGDKFENIRVYVHNDCPVTTPYDIHQNQKIEVDRMHGTCGVGFGETLEREESHFHLKFSDLFNSTLLKIKLEQIAKYYALFYKSEIDIKNFMDAVDVLNSNTLFPADVIVPVEDNEVPAFPATIYEGSQGLLLDQDIGFFPHVTRSNVGRKRLDQFIYHYDEVWYVTRAYQTRHGHGPMTNEEIPMTLVNLEGETNVENPYQGMFRRSLLDLDLLKYALQQDRKEKRRVQEERLVITCLDQMVDWRFTENGNVFQTEDEDSFIMAIVSGLNFTGKVYLSRSSNNEITEWKGGKDD